MVVLPTHSKLLPYSSSSPDEDSVSNLPALQGNFPLFPAITGKQGSTGPLLPLKMPPEKDFHLQCNCSYSYFLPFLGITHLLPD